MFLPFLAGDKLTHLDVVGEILNFPSEMKARGNENDFSLPESEETVDY